MDSVVCGDEESVRGLDDAVRRHARIDCARHVSGGPFAIVVWYAPIPGWRQWAGLQGKSVGCASGMLCSENIMHNGGNTSRLGQDCTGCVLCDEGCVDMPNPLVHAWSSL